MRKMKIFDFHIHFRVTITNNVWNKDLKNPPFASGVFAFFIIPVQVESSPTKYKLDYRRQQTAHFTALKLIS